MRGELPVNDTRLTINTALVQRLIATQFPQWATLLVKPVAVGGWDNRTFHLGEDMLVRLPSAACYAAKVEKEQKWLPRLAPFLPLPIPEPLAMGRPGEEYLWQWSIYRWIEGETAAASPILEMCEFASTLAHFLTALQHIDPREGPPAGAHNFYRGGSLSIYDRETRRAIAILKDKIDGHAATLVWEEALATSWQRAPVWVHGDISPGNLLVRDGKLSAVIDFGGLAVGDPACDLAIAWTFFRDKSREVFRKTLALDARTWARGKAWALWKALIVAAGLCETNSVEAVSAWKALREILEN